MTTTWRDYTNQLTPQQIRDLETQERRGADCSPDTYRTWLISEAQDLAAENRRDAELNARIHPPAGTTPGGWDSIDATERRHRSIHWATFEAGRTAIDIDGTQDETGAIDGPHLSVFGLDDCRPLTAAEARELATALVAAADELDRLEGV